MSIKKKIVWLPYDFDTAIGINNEGALVFDYALEDTDHLSGGTDIYNGQDSVIWNNIRDAFGAELADMYKTLRSTGVLSYAKVEQMFEQHQAKWPEAVFNEDAWFKYIDPLINDGDGAYLDMLQGSKAEQRKWWLYNRFRYIDSKYNAGDALSDLIQLRGYAKADITVKPYADIYPSIKYGSYLVQQRGKRGVATTLVCPLDNVNDTEIYIYSSSQLASVGDLSGLKVGFANFAMATRLQEIKIGDADSNYDNPNLASLTLGNNVLLKKIDVRNCSGLGDTTKEGHTQQTVDISGCSIVEEVYFDGTKITGLTLPNGGVLKKLHLPETMTNLTILNQKGITELVLPSYDNISTLRLENTPTLDTKAILNSVPASTRVRLIDFTWEAQDAEEIETILDKLDTMRGLDESGGNMDAAQVSGTIHTSALTGAQIASYNARYPYLTITADHVTSYLTCKTWDGETTVQTITCLDGVPQSALPAVPARTSTAQYSYTAVGWNTTTDAEVNDPNAAVNVIADRTIYAAYSRTVRSYTITWKNADGAALKTETLAYGTMPSYSGATPTYEGQTSTGWTPAVATVTGDQTYTAVYVPMYTATFMRASEDGGGTLYTHKFMEGSTPSYSGSTPTTTRGGSEDFTFVGWTPALAPIYTNTTYYATFRDNRSPVITYLLGTIAAYESSSNVKVAGYAFRNRTALKTVAAPLTTVEADAFSGCTALETVDLTGTAAATLSVGAFNGCTKLEALIIRSTTMSTLSNVSALTGTAIALGNGAVYVPAALVATYKADANWKNFFIASIDDYPLSDYSTISDTWAEIFAAEANDTYKTKYSIGDTKSVTVNGQKVYMQIAAFDEGSSKISWVAKNLLSTTHVMNSTAVTTDGWAASEMRSWLRETIYPTIDETVRSHIVPVTKTYKDVTTSSVLSIEDTVWIPSHREVFGASTYEDSGVTYTDLFKDATSRIKYQGGSAYLWWLRSADSTGYFGCVSDNGNDGSSSANRAHGVALGFCT